MRNAVVLEHRLLSVIRLIPFQYLHKQPASTVRRSALQEPITLSTRPLIPPC